MLRVLILEDEPMAAEHLVRQLHRFDTTIEILSTLPSVEKTLQWLKKNNAPDLIFMDIQLEDELVFVLFEKIDLHIPAIFTTAYDEYFLKAFKVSGIDYLLKPVEYEQLEHALNKYNSLSSHFSPSQQEQLLRLLERPQPVPYRSRFMISFANKIQSINVSEVAYFFVSDKNVFLTTNKGANLPIDYRLDDLETQLDPKMFFRINRQFIVSHQSVQQGHLYSGGKLKLDIIPTTRQEVFVSGDRLTAFKEWLGK
ncbi:DNA-binding response regulator [Pseudochryseolinea flava]|uniref:DNA-binding response regulator n=2 Tax=Pseudochryseolinea flava TaxID=2059302 RepID=A0A364Y445_9BACT|nr:DNA-binding response regulator [Pseudochryseolinea flava]